MTKSEIRKKYKDLRSTLSDKEIEDKSLAIANAALKLTIWDKTYFHLFLSIDEQKEIKTEYLLSILQGKDKEVVVAKTDFETTTMVHYLLTDNTKFIKNKYNIPEPTDGIEVPETKIDVVFVPLLGFDKMGNRVGYGKGFYDKFLLKCKPDVLKIGLSFFEPEELITGVFESDVQLDYCITPLKIYTF